jgi:OOP family OmpA-OmpF porin
MARLRQLILLALLATTTAKAQHPDVPGASDPPLIKRFSGSWLAGARSAEWEAAAVPAGPERQKTDERRFQALLELEGRVSQLVYIAPRGKSSLEVWRNYEQALNAAGFKKRWSCERDCANTYFAWSQQLQPTKGFTWAQGYVDTPSGSRYSLTSALSHDQSRFLVGTLGAPGREVHVLLFTSLAANHTTGLVATYLQIVEPKAMTTDQVAVDASAIGQGLKDEGKVALYGVLFDTGKTEVLPDSKAQLDQMAAMLKAQPAIKVYIVGHTDNVGALDANLALSQGRAQAVVAALTQRGIAPARLLGRGVASLAPVASNASDEGRAKNRRVEMVLQ